MSLSFLCKSPPRVPPTGRGAPSSPPLEVTSMSRVRDSVQQHVEAVCFVPSPARVYLGLWTKKGGWRRPKPTMRCNGARSRRTWRRGGRRKGA
eukprot:scaffold868_cov351-Pavlova_lutheri.AAC.16